MVAVCVVLVSGLILVNTRAEMSHERSVVSDSLLRRSAGNVESLTGALRQGGETESQMNAIAGQPGISGPACGDALATVQGAIHGAFIVVVDKTGTVTCSAAPSYVKAGVPAFTGLAELRTAIASGKGSTGGPFTDARTHKLSMFTQVPMPSRPGTSLVYVFDTQHELSLLADKGMTSIVVDTRSGTVLSHYPPMKGAVGSATDDNGLVGVLGSTRGVRSGVGPDGVKRLYRSIPLHGTPFLLMVGVSEDEALAAVRAGLVRNLGIGAAMLLLVGALGLILQRRIARPARRLGLAIHALATDPEAPDAPVEGPNELAAVAATFNDTADARRRADGLSRAILQHASDLLLVLDGSFSLAFVGAVAERELGLTVGDGAGTLLGRLHPDDRERCLNAVREWAGGSEEDLEIEARVHDAHGSVRWMDVRAQDLRSDRSVAGIVLTCRDVTDRKAFEEHLAHQARHDSLTGLANRAAVLDRLTTDLADPAAGPVCVFFIDLDRFKLVNDSHGHAVGDKVLIALARKLRDLADPADLLGRFGGDEFVLVVTGRVSTAAAAGQLARSIRKTLEEPLLVGRRELFVAGSVGIALAVAGDAPEVVLRNADTAMYRAKAQGRNCSAFFDEEMRADAKRQLRTESDLHRALERDQLVVHFQPVLSVVGESVLGVEALVRWNHPAHGLVPPGDFIPIAEETGLVVPIGAWVLETSCAWAVDAAQRIGRPIRVSVNVSPRQLAQPDIVDLVDEVLEKTGLPAELLCLEVTESVLVQDAHVAGRALAALHERGVRLSIDDFGTGWSSLTYLQQFPVDEIKLDRSYVGKVDKDKTSATIVGALVGMAHAMGLTVTAEGVETQEQLRFLRAHRCDTAQGFLFARPMPGETVVQLLTSQPAGLPVQRESHDESVA